MIVAAPVWQEDRDGSERAHGQIDALPHPLEEEGLDLANGLPAEGLSHTVQRERGEDLRDHRQRSMHQYEAAEVLFVWRADFPHSESPVFVVLALLTEEKRSGDRDHSEKWVWALWRGGTVLTSIL